MAFSKPLPNWISRSTFRKRIFLITGTVLWAGWHSWRRPAVSEHARGHKAVTAVISVAFLYPQRLRKVNSLCPIAATECWIILNRSFAVLQRRDVLLCAVGSYNFQLFAAWFTMLLCAVISIISTFSCYLHSYTCLQDVTTVTVNWIVVVSCCQVSNKRCQFIHCLLMWPSLSFSVITYCPWCLCCLYWQQWLWPVHILWYSTFYCL